MFRKFKFYIMAGALLLLAVLLLFNKVFIIGLIVLGLTAFLVLLWEFLLKEKMQQIDTLNEELLKVKAENQKLEQENEDYAKRKLNISEINTVLELGLFEVNTNFKRTVNQQFNSKGKDVQFIGVINVDFIAKYGVDFHKLMFKIDEENREIFIKNADPEFLSFTKRACTWEIAEILELNTPFFGSEHWKTNPRLDHIASKLKEEIRAQVEKDTENGPSELKWITEPLRHHVERALELIFGVKGYSIRFTELQGADYLSLDDYTRKNNQKQLIQPSS